MLIDFFLEFCHLLLGILWDYIIRHIDINESSIIQEVLKVAREKHQVLSKK